MLLVQKLLNHPVFTLPAWQLKGCQTLLQFVIYTQLRWFGPQVLVCVCACSLCQASSVSHITFVFFFPSTSLYHLLYFHPFFLFMLHFCFFLISIFFCPLKRSSSPCHPSITPPFSLTTTPASFS